MYPCSRGPSRAAWSTLHEIDAQLLPRAQKRKHRQHEKQGIPRADPEALAGLPSEQKRARGEQTSSGDPGIERAELLRSLGSQLKSDDLATVFRALIHLQKHLVTYDEAAQKENGIGVSVQRICSGKAETPAPAWMKQLAKVLFNALGHDTHGAEADRSSDGR